LEVVVPEEPEVPDEPVPPLLVPPAEVPPAEVPPDVVPPVAAPVPVLPDDVVPLDVDGVVVAAPVPEDVVPLDVDGAVEAGEVVLLGDVSDGEVLDAVSLLPDDDAVRVEPPSDTFSGATSSAVCFGIVSCVTLLPPQALSPPVARSIKAMAVVRRRIRERGSLSLRTARSAVPSGARRSGSR
jgi:hypothetical protein